MPFLIAAVVASGLHQQGTSASDQAAAKAPTSVLRKTVAPQWIGTGDRFWYQRERDANMFEFVLVDAKSGTRKVFPNKEMLQANAGIEAVSVKAELLERAPRPQRGLESREVWLTFANKSDKPAELFWIDAGKEQSYGVLQSGITRRLRTFSGHLWQVRRSDASSAGFLRAGASDAVVDITSAPPRRASSNAVPRKLVVRNHNLALLGPDGTQKMVTTSGTEADAFSGNRVWMAPNGRYAIAFRETKPQSHPVILRNTRPKNSIEPTYETIEYPKPGDAIAKPTVVLLDLENATETALSSSFFPSPWSLTQLGSDPWADGVTWSRDSKQAWFVYNQRGHQLLRICRIDVTSKVITSVLDETSKTFIDYQAKFGAWLDKDEKTLYWMSERSGYNHIYALDPQKSSEQALKPVTSGAWNVKSITGYQPDSNEMDAAIVGFHKNQDPYYVHYARIDLKAGKVAMLTESDGTHRIQVSPNRKYLVDTWSRVDKAPVTELRDANSGKLIMPLEVADTSRREALGIPTIERFVAPGRDGKTLIYGNVIRPIGWSREKKYPVIEQVYAGPQDHYVAKAWSDHMGYMQKLADKGFIVVQLDGMGTNWRGKAFHDVCYKNLRDGGFPDRVAWIKALAAKDSSVDTSRVGVYGGSAGGQNAVAALIWHGDFYKAAVADCGCHDNRMDKTWWNELWMGYPVDDSYRLSSNVEFAHQITGDLMLVVGEIDHNVDPASTMQVVDALIKADKDFDLLVIPGSDHGAAESPYGRRRRTDFFVNKLLGKPVKL